MSKTTKTFQYTSIIPASLETVIRFHEKPSALRKLTPPPIIVQMVKDERKSLTEGTLEFVLWFGPIPVHWVARHEKGPVPTSFIDRMISGPMAEWEHQHIFRAIDGGVELIDHLTFAHKAGWRGWLTRFVFDGLPLRILFWYRHWRTKFECQR